MKNINDKKIWVIDDDNSILEVMKIVLEDAGYNVWTISDIELFNKQLKIEHPDLILLDIWMSEKDGCEISKDLKSKDSTKNIPIILVSALSDYKKIVKESNANGLLKKPFDVNELLKIVKKYLNG